LTGSWPAIRSTESPFFGQQEKIKPFGRDERPVPVNRVFFVAGDRA
jgi:hypothetical protein